MDAYLEKLKRGRGVYGVVSRRYRNRDKPMPCFMEKVVNARLPIETQSDSFRNEWLIASAGDAR